MFGAEIADKVSETWISVVHVALKGGSPCVRFFSHVQFFA